MCRTLTGPLTCLLFWLTAIFFGATADQSTTNRIIPNHYIVEFEPHKADDAHNIVSSLVDHVDANTHFTARPLITYNEPKYFVGAVIHLEHKNSPPPQEGTQQSSLSSKVTLAKLAKAPDVHKVYQAKYLSLHKPLHATKSRRAVTDAALHQRRRKSSKATPNTTQVPPSLISTGIATQNQKGNLGAGIRLCVIDQPMDYSHPALNGGKPAGTPCVGKGCKVEGGYDWYGPSTKGNDFDPAPLTLDAVHGGPFTCEHGTHVAGLAAGNDTAYPGAAPDVTLRSYAIFGCLDNVQSPSTEQADYVIIQAIIQAAKDECDVINGSFGGADWPSSLVSTVASRVNAEGITYVAAAGNEGVGGLFSLSCPGCSDTLSVGASTDDIVPGIALKLSPPLPNGKSDLFVFSESLWTWNETIANVPVFFLPPDSSTPADMPGNACNLEKANIKDLKGVLVIAGPGDCDLNEQARQLALHHASYLILSLNDFRDVASLFALNQDPKVGGLLKANISTLFKASKTNPDMRVSVNVKDPLHFVSHANIGPQQVTFFSSRGPAYDGSLKPDVLAPGSRIASAFPLPALYGNLAGTSMASPITSGAVALLKAVKGKQTPSAAIRQRLVQSARSVKESSAKEAKTQSVYMQGGGVINVTAAIELTTLTEPYHVDLKDTAMRGGQNTRNLTISNVGSGKQSYKLSQIPAQSYLALRNDGERGKYDAKKGSPWSSLPDKVDEEAALDFHPAEFSLDAGKSQVVSLTVRPPADNDRLLAFSGHIQIDSSESEGSSTVPYAGFAGSFRDVQTIGRFKSEKKEFPALYNFSSSEMIKTDDSKWAFQLNSSDLTVQSLPAAPTEQFTCDLVAADINYEATIPLDLGRPRIKQDKKLRFQDVPVVVRFLNETLQAKGSFDHKYECHGNATGADPITGEDKTVNPGKYRFLLRSHRWTLEDYDLDSSYDSYLSHAFTYVGNN
ncbi:unnamed protein product [Sympodiomycopsis kandeliae]